MSESAMIEIIKTVIRADTDLEAWQRERARHAHEKKRKHDLIKIW